MLVVRAHSCSVWNFTWAVKWIKIIIDVQVTTYESLFHSLTMTVVCLLVVTHHCTMLLLTHFLDFLEEFIESPIDVQERWQQLLPHFLITNTHQLTHSLTLVTHSECCHKFIHLLIHSITFIHLLNRPLTHLSTYSFTPRCYTSPPSCTQWPPGSNTHSPSPWSRPQHCCSVGRHAITSRLFERTRRCGEPDPTPAQYR